jgi:hypothetical protein
LLVSVALVVVLAGRRIAVLEESVLVATLELDHGPARGEPAEIANPRSEAVRTRSSNCRTGRARLAPNRQIGLDVDDAQVEIGRRVHHLVLHARQVPDELPSMDHVPLGTDALDGFTPEYEHELYLWMEV